MYNPILRDIERMRVMVNSYQDVILAVVRKESIPITVYLTSGFQIRGMLKAFDNYVIILETEGKQQMIYKHAISTIVPLRSVSFTNEIGQD